MQVHTELGPGLLESAYAKSLAAKFRGADLAFASQGALSLNQGGVQSRRAYVADFIVENSLLIELKTVDRLLPVHTSQVVTYLKLAKLRKGLIFNFRVAHMRDGIRSVILAE